MRKFFQQYWFLFSLVVVLAWGTNDHIRLTPLSEIAWLKSLNLALVLFLMALPLEFKALWETVRRPLAPGLAIVITYGLAPLVAAFIAPWLGPEYGPGLLVAAALPCTMASAAVWTRKAGGNDAIALFVTAVTNFFCFLVLPALLVWTIGERAKNANINAAALRQQLLWLVVLPIIAGQLLRLIQPVARFADRFKSALGNLAQMGILLMVFLGAIETGNRWAVGEGKATLGDFIVMIAAVCGLHLFLLFTGLLSARGLGLKREDRIAVAFSGSQKTLMIGLQVADSCNFSILPIICYHVLQLFLDTILAERFRANAPVEVLATGTIATKTPTSPSPSNKAQRRKKKSGRKGGR